MSTVLALIVLAATLGAGGYVVYRKITKAFAVVSMIVGGALAHLAKLSDRVAVATEAIAKRPVAATIHQQNLGLVPVHDLQAVVGAMTVAPRSDATIRLEPVRAVWFHAKAIRILAYVDGMPSIEQRVTIGRCEVGSMPMFQWSGDGWSYARGDGLTSLGLPSDVFAAPPGHAVGVDLKVFSDMANRAPLEFSVRNDNPHPVRVCIEAYGEPLAHPRDLQDPRERPIVTEEDPR